MKILDFVAEMKERATKELVALSEGGSCVKRTYTFTRGHAEITTIRGGAVEKAAITLLTLKGMKMPETGEEVDPMVYQMEVYPENPHCPMGHFNAEWTSVGPGPYYMNLDLFPAVRVEEDLTAMKRIMDGVADRFGRDRNRMREGLDVQYNMEHWSLPLAAKAGCKLMKLGEDELDFFITAYHTFFAAYLDILKQRRDTPFGDEQIRLKQQRNGKWLEYIAFKDGAVKMAQVNGIPAEVLKGITFPPSVLF